MKKSGHKNVTWHATRERWYARFWRDGKMHHVGYWPKDKLKAAIRAVRQAIKNYETPPYLGDC